MSIASRALIRNVGFVLAAILIFFVSVSGNASAATYRYWNFWTQNANSWSFSPIGPASTNPVEGSAQAWRFDASSPSVPGVAPADSPDAVFERACADVMPIVGTKRVAIVIDSGDPALAPDGETPSAPVAYCAVGKVDANGYDLLKTVVELRTDNGLICGISGYPASECASPVSDYLASESAQPIADAVAIQDFGDASRPPETSSLAPIGTAVVVGLIAVAGFYFWRRRKS